MILNILLGCANFDIDYVYRDEDAAASEILRQSDESDRVRILGIRGNRIADVERPLNAILRSERKYKDLCFLCAHPDSPALEKRDTGFEESNITYVKGQYKDDVFRCMNTLAECSKKNSRIKVGTHFQPESFRIIFTDKYLFLSFFIRGKTASKSPVYRIKKGSYLYKAFDAHYSWVEETAKWIDY